MPILVAEADEVELCTYIYMGRRVWGFYVRQLILPQKGAYLSEVLIIFDPIAEEIIHCMRPNAVRPYCMRRRDFVGIRGRWRRRSNFSFKKKSSIIRNKEELKMKENQLIDRIKDQLARYEHWVVYLTELDGMEMEALLLLRDEIEENMWRLSNPFMEWKGNLRRIDNELQRKATLCSIKLDGYFVNKTNPPSSAWWWYLFDTSDNADADSFGSLDHKAKPSVSETNSLPNAK